MKLDVLVFAAHPDDAELSCSGTIAKLVSMNKKVGIIDFTQGELGTRGTPQLRLQEAQKASEILGLSIRENAGFRDGFFQNDENHQLKLIYFIRKYQPEIIFANAFDDRHIDHVKGAQLAKYASFLSGLAKIETFENNKLQTEWRPKRVFHYIQDKYLEPDFVIDISKFWDIKINSIHAFASQFYNPNSSEKESYISNPDFIRFIEARGREMGHKIGATFGEGFQCEQMISPQTPLDLI